MGTKASAPAIVPRRVSVTSHVILFPEPRFAWAVPTEVPFAIEKAPAYQIIGISHARSVIEYAAEAGAARTTAELMYEAAEDAMNHEADWPVVRFIPLEGLEDGAIAPEAIAFSLEDAEARAAARAAKAAPKKKSRTRITSLARGLKEITGTERAPAEAHRP
jgi:hypothetical protein